MTIELFVDSVSVYSGTGEAGPSAAITGGFSVATGVGQKKTTATGTATASATATGRTFTGYAGFAFGGSTSIGQSTFTGGGSSFPEHVQLFVDTVKVYDSGSGSLTFVASASAHSTVTGLSGSIRAGAGHASGVGAVTGRSLAPGGGVGLASGNALVVGHVMRRSVGFAAGVARVGSPLDFLGSPPLTGRSMTASMNTAIVQTVVRPVLLYEGEFKDGMLNLWSGYGELEWNGKVWTGAGPLLSISPVEETDQQQASGIVVSLSAVPSSQIALSLAQVQRNQPGHIWLGLLDSAEHLIDTPQTIFRGRLDTVSIEDSEETATIKASYENEMITFEHAREIRYTDQEQKRLFPGDRGCEYIAGLQDKTLRWGSRP